MARLSCIALLSLASAACATLNELAQAAGKLYFGSATDNGELNDTAYVAILSDHSTFGQITPANSWKWELTEPEQDTFTFAQANQILDFAQANGQLLRGHNCVWHSQLPDWVVNGTWTADALAKVVASHCKTLVGHFSGATYSFDIVNEPFNEDGTLQSNVFFDTLGIDYIPLALNAAREVDNATKLYINEFNIEFAGPKQAAMAGLVAELKANDTPIDGVGLQAHFIVGEVPSAADLQAVLENFTALGVEVAYTELDIRMTLPVTDALLAQQKTDYENVVAACMAVEKCVGITVWDYTDKYSWVPSTFPGQGAPCPWDENLNTKPAFDGIVESPTA